MSDNSTDDRDINALPLDWQETAKERGIRHVINELEKAPATQADIARIKRDREQLAERLEAEVRVLSNELGLNGPDPDAMHWDFQPPRLRAHSDQIRDLYSEMGRIEREAPSTGLAVTLSVIALVVALVALGIAIFN